MDFESIAAQLDGIPYTDRRQGRALFNFVRRHRVSSVLELGFAHGVSTCYLAAGVIEHGGRVLTIDNSSALDREPSIRDLIETTGLAAVVAPIFAHRSYTWELMHLIESRSDEGVCRPMFDFCFIDGGHSWEDTGLAFFLVEKLLLPGATVLFDDLTWTYATSPVLRDSPMVRAMSDRERTTPQVGRVFELLVRQHPSFECIRVEGPWGWARKRLDSGEALGVTGSQPIDGYNSYPGAQT